jgi:DNA polymerase phi
LEALASKFLEDGINSPDQLQLVLAIQSAAPEFDLKKKFATWKNADALSVANLPKLARILKETPSEDEEVKSSGSNWHPQLHSVWDILLEQIASGKATKGSKASFQEFWKVTVDGMNIFQRVINAGMRNLSNHYICFNREFV